MYVDRTFSVYESVRGTPTRQEENFHISYDGWNSCHISWDSRLRHSFTWDKWWGVDLWTQNKEHHEVFLEVIRGRMPYAVFADYIEERREHLMTKERNPGDWDRMLQTLRTWGIT